MTWSSPSPGPARLRRRRSPWGGLALGRSVLGLCGLLLLGCNVGTDKPYLAGEPLAPLQMVSTEPLDDASHVPTNVAPSALWNDRVHPDSLTADAVILRAGVTALVASARADLIDCSVRVRPLAPLQPSTAHEVAFEGLRGFATGSQPASVVVAFTTGDGTAPDEARPVPSFAEIYAEVIGPRCSSCHRALRPPAGLDLSSPEVAEPALLSGGTTRLQEVPYVVPGDHAASYLMWKLLGLPGIAGQAMPPSGPFPSDRACGTPDPGLRRIADWVDGLGP